MSSIDPAVTEVDAMSQQVEESVAEPAAQGKQQEEAVITAEGQSTGADNGKSPQPPDDEIEEQKNADAYPTNESEPQGVASATTFTEPTGDTPTASPTERTVDTHNKIAFTQPSPTAAHRVRSPVKRTAISTSPSRVDVAPQPTSSAAGVETYVEYTGATEVYTRAEAERIAAAAAALTPNTVLGLFRRGGDNSHTNRMEAGSYSRYLLSTDHMPPIVLSGTFHGEQPALGTMPRNTVKPRASGEPNDSFTGGEELQQAEHSRAATHGNDSTPISSAAASARHSTRRASTSSATLPANAQMRTTWSSTAGSGTLKREVEMLDADIFAGLDEVRRHRRQDPRKGKPAQLRLDYVYYNHKSKGFYVPHDPSPDTTMLHYNHMYNFGDGTRFSPLATSPTATTATTEQQQQQRRTNDGSNRHHCNPHAAPPRTFAETRGCTFALTASQRQQKSTAVSSARIGSGRPSSRTTNPNGMTATTTMSEADVAQQQRRRQRAEIQNGTSSLRTATAIDLTRLHRTKCPRPRTIEEVLADQQLGYLYNGSAPHPLVHDIKKEVSRGKLVWGEVPTTLQVALTAASTAAAAQPAAYEFDHNSQQQQQYEQSYPRNGSAEQQQQQQQRSASLSQPLNGLVDVMGHLRTMPAIVAATAARSTNGTAAADEELYPTSMKRQSKTSGKASAAVSVSQLPVISRLNYSK